MDVKKGLRNPLDAAQVRKAVLALQTFVAKQKAALPKTPLVENPEYVSAIITRKLIPAKGSHKPIQIPIPHSIRGGENDAEMCLIVKNGDKARIKAALAADPVPGLAKIIEIKKLKKNFSRFDDKRTLAGAYDLFLADDRIVPYLPEALGTKFFVKKKQPVVVRVSRKDVSNAIRSVYQRTQMVVSTGACTNVKVAHLAMGVDDAVENILVAMNNCAAHIPKGWNGVQSISIKTNESVALPIYNALATLAKLPPTSKKEALTKRKLEELETEVAPPKAAKKAKKESQEALAAAPTKKEAKEKETALATVAKKDKKDKKKKDKKEASKESLPQASKELKKAKKDKKEISAQTAPSPAANKAKDKESKKRTANKELAVESKDAKNAKKEGKEPKKAKASKK